jgi:aspartyl-tRNA(Asn)/glutamyl-tRNA(Gln) amidotransferase subunit B
MPWKGVVGIKVTIGFEIHEQLNTRTKLYCNCPTNYREVPPNHNVCEVCTGMPGSKPFPINQDAVDAAIEIALMLNCEIIPDPIYVQRKHYDYPDLPSGYQRTSLPIGKNGNLDGVGIWEVHLEEDPGQYDPITGKVDYNRSGVPLVEIVSAPDIHSPEDGRRFLRALITVLQYTGKVRPEGGTMRTDTNISLEGGARVEIKNINSVKGAYRALKFEMARQKNMMKRGVAVKRETRAFIESSMITRGMRTKEEAEDYRYIPDPDIPPLLVTDEKIESVRAVMPEAPHLKEKRFVEQYGVKADDAHILASELELANAFEEVAKEIDPPMAASWIRDIVKKSLNYRNLSFSESGLTPGDIITILDNMGKGEITPRSAEMTVRAVIEMKKPAGWIIENSGFKIIREAGTIEQAVAEAIKENPGAVSDYKSGKEEAVFFIVGKVMGKTKGRAEPKVVLEKVKEGLKDA